MNYSWLCLKRFYGPLPRSLKNVWGSPSGIANTLQGTLSATSLDAGKMAEEIFKTFKGENFAKQREELNEYIKKFGIANYKQFLNNHINDWNTYPLRIAVSESSGQGKSSLINTLRGLKPTSDGAAQVCTVECTHDVAEYSDPKHPNLIYYDLPGVGTPNFPSAEYFNIIKNKTKDNIEFKDFDFFLILSADRFTEEDVWLAKHINKGGKQFYFIRTKIDNDLRNSYEDYPDNYNEENTLETIRKKCLEELIKLNLRTTESIDIDWSKKIFLLSTKFAHSNKWNFPQMITSLVKDYPSLKREAIIISITANCKDIIREKVNVLRNRIWMFALANCLGGVVPIPGASVAADLAVVGAALFTYKQNLGLDDESLKILAESYNVTVGTIELQLASSAVYSAYFVGGDLAKHAIADGSEQLLKRLTNEAITYFPFLGAIVGGGLSFGTTYYQLDQMLNDLEQAAFDVLHYVTRASSKQQPYHDEL
ncbi:unnamed protein product [Didymodactylos carnosus]|uniref:IRG-type G domain-containing protein n=1 Tax=Didymodactylos carnosus TaxID=1234261 RepID=A0A8S2CZH9_9BILA|nr:unnamed protein product [Didymodactylos carnosus]CAF3592372.1 unnamed protein product [Didymodactylos carnosus]